MPKLHKVTWFFIILGILELLGTIWSTADGASEILRQYRLGDRSVFAVFGFMIPQYFYALHWLGTAALAEFLTRILSELRAMRLAKAAENES